jgi:hypothetical protein
MWAMVAIVSALTAQTPPAVTSDPPVHFEISARLYQAGGMIGNGMSRAGVSEREPAVTWQDPASCSSGASTGGYPLPTLSASGILWTTSARILRRDAGTYVVEVTARRDGGAIAPKQLTLRLDEWQTVDIVPVASNNRCGASEIRLDITVVADGKWAPNTTAAGGRGSAGALGGSGGSGVAAGPRATGGGSATASGGAGGVGASGVSTGISALAFLEKQVGQLGASATERSFFEGSTKTSPAVTLNAVEASCQAQVWLVITAPDGSVRTSQQGLHLRADGATFRFLGLAIGRDHVYVAVNLRPMITTEGQNVLRAVIARVVSNVSEGASNRAVPLPANGDVVSFEMPMLQESLADYHFEVRVRLTPGG